MSGGQERDCDACGGTGLTDKTQHTVDLDENGHQVHVQRSFVSSCTHCSGAGKVSG